MGDGASLLYIGNWMSEHANHIFAFGGGDAFYMYTWSNETEPSDHVVINEIEQNPSGTDSGNEWIELYNPTTSDVNLDGWKVSTTHGITVTVTLYGTIPAKGYFCYTHTKQWLDNEYESVILRDPLWNEIDRTPYISDTYNNYRSWQRYPNGIDTNSDPDWKYQPSTKGYSNGVPPPQKGDLNHDGEITSVDVQIALTIAFCGEYIPKADIDENGCVNILDVRMIMQAAAV